MNRLYYSLLLLSLVSACTPQNDAGVEESEWAEIEALANDAETVLNTREKKAVVAPMVGTVDESEFSPFIQQLDKMKSVARSVGETLITGRSLTFDYDQRYILLNEDVVVEDDEGTLKAETLTGRFSVTNTVEFVEAGGGVTLVNSNRTASADHAIYNHRSGFVKLEGKARASEGGNRLSGERIQLWVRGDRRMICEPNALLQISGDSGLELKGVEGAPGEETEIRADRAVYDELQSVAELVGNVRVRDSRAAMNCENVRLYLKEDNEIDWIEALGGVIIQSEDRRALAERALYESNEGKFTLEGEPKVKQGQNVMTGDRILFWHETRRMVCEPNARVLLYLDEETKAKFLKDLDE